MPPYLPTLLGFGVPLYALDQITKWLVLQHIPVYSSVPVIPGVFNLVHVYNTGAAFGLGKDNNLFFLLLASAALLILLGCWAFGCFKSRSTRIAVAILIPGVAGNLTDRIFHGHVIDFFDVILPWYGHWPAFNIADSCICIAAALLVWNSLFSKQPAAETPAPSNSNN